MESLAKVQLGPLAAGQMVTRKATVKELGPSIWITRNDMIKQASDLHASLLAMKVVCHWSITVRTPANLQLF
jgi:hypothetical protein